MCVLIKLVFGSIEWFDLWKFLRSEEHCAGVIGEF